MLLKYESQPNDDRAPHWYCGMLLVGLITAVGASVVMLRTAVADETRRTLLEKAELAAAGTKSACADKACETTKRSCEASQKACDTAKKNCEADCESACESAMASDLPEPELIATPMPSAVQASLEASLAEAIACDEPTACLASDDAEESDLLEQIQDLLLKEDATIRRLQVRCDALEKANRDSDALQLLKQIKRRTESFQQVAYLFDQQEAFEEIEELRLEVAQLREQMNSQAAAPVDRQTEASPAPVLYQLAVADVSAEHYSEVAKALSLDHPHARHAPLEETLKELAERKLIRVISSPALITMEGCEADFVFPLAAHQVDIKLLPTVVREGESVQTQLRFREAGVDDSTRRVSEIQTPLELKCDEMAVLAPSMGRLVFVTASLPPKAALGKLPATRR